MRSEEFLRLYRILEESLETKYARTPRTTSSVVMEYLRDESSLLHRDKLNLCPELRNLLTHNATDNGEPVIEPSDWVVRILREIVEEVRQPLKALAFATPANIIIRAKPNFGALRLMRTMEEKGYSHIPVYDGAQFRGVFSVSTVFSYLAAYPGRTIDDQTAVSTFRQFLPIDKHMSERFIFMNPDAIYSDIKRAFETSVKKHKRVAVIFLTDTGEPGGQLQGLVTPWDVLGKVQGENTLIEDADKP